MATEEAARLYIYAITGPDVPERMRVLGRTLLTLRVSGVAVIAEKSREDHAVSEESLRRQHAIVEALAERVDSLLPVRFGTVASAADLQTRILGARGKLRSALELVRGMTQMTVRIYMPVSQAFVSHPSAAAGLTGTEYLEGRRGDVESLRADAAAIRAAAGPVVVHERVDSGRPPMRGTVFHLIRRADVAQYTGMVKACEPSLAPAKLTITGPFAPFAFAPEL